MLVDLRVAQLLCSRLCHDLVGPVGAIAAGLELIGDGGADEAEAMALVAASGQAAGRRLAFYRAAFGLGADATRPVAELRALAQGLLAEGKVALDWPAEPDDAGPAPALAASAARLVLNMVLLGAEALPRGGKLTLSLAGLDAGLGVAVRASGEGARLTDEVKAALGRDAAPERLTARTVQAYLAARLAEAAGAQLEVSTPVAGEVRLAAMLYTPSTDPSPDPGADPKFC